jgi:microcystin-dependent protein
MAFADWKFAYLVNKLTPGGTITLDRNIWVTSWRLYLSNDNQEEWINFTSSTLSGTYYVLGWVTRDVDPVAIPMTSMSSGKTWLANQKVTLVQAHDQIFDASSPEALVFATTSARDTALWGDWVATKAYINVYVTATGLFYNYNTSLSVWQALGTSVPLPTTITGEIRIYAWISAPSGWFICDGSAISRTTYAGLFAIVSTSYGIWDGSTTFNLPNLKWRVPVWYDVSQVEFNTMWKIWGANTHTLTEAQIPAHNHQLLSWYSWGGWWTVIAKQSGVSSATLESGWIGNTWGWQAHNNLQPYQTIQYIIKS